AGYAAGKCLTMQQRLDRRFVRAVLTEAGARLVLRHRYASSPSVHPDGAAVHEQRTRRPERVDEVLGRCGREADQVDDRVRLEIGDRLPERAADSPRGAVGVHTLPRPPLDGLVVRRPLAATDRYDLVTSANQPGHEVAADVARRAN